MDVSIVIVNWNSEDFLRECLRSIRAQARKLAIEIIVVDNASPAAGIDEVKLQFPELVAVKSETNLGFSRANNLGFRHASGKYLLFLNPDTSLVNPAIDILFEQAETLPDAGILGGKLLNTDLSVQTSCIQAFPTILNQILDVEFLRLRWPGSRLWKIGPLFSETKSPARVDMISGAALMIRRDVFEQVGLFSEDYFMYAEDLDLCYKVDRAGFHNYYVGEAVIVHHGGTSSGKRVINHWATITKFRSLSQFWTKTKGTFYGGVYRMVIGIVALVRMMILGVVFPFGSLFRKNPGGSFSKWLAVFRWAAGLES